MPVPVTASYLEDAREIFRNYKHQAERAMEQVPDVCLTRTLDAESNSIATIVKHLAGNMRSRWTDFLTSDGEKPDRNRDAEFIDPPPTREGVMFTWDRGWRYLFAGLDQLTDDDLGRTVTIRGEAHSVLQAINRQLAHQAMHVGQIILLAKHFAGENWKAITIPRGKSEEFNRGMHAPSATEQEPLNHVSDTALMVAAARAAETRRPNPLCTDPFAERLAGERGNAILKGTSGWYWMSFGMGLRTKFIDAFIADEIARHGINCVLCFGAGLDTRPWRLDLPSGFRWIEVDFPAILDYKYGTLKDETPHCRLERFSVDLTDDTARRGLWERVARTRTLLLTEGLLMYLPGDTVRAITREARDTAAIEAWISDFHSPALLKAAHGAGAARINSLRAPTSLNAGELRQTMQDNGWRLDCDRRFIRDGGQLAWERMKADGIQPDPQAGTVPEDDPAGVGLLHRA